MSVSLSKMRRNVDKQMSVFMIQNAPVSYGCEGIIQRGTTTIEINPLITKVIMPITNVIMPITKLIMPITKVIMPITKVIMHNKALVIC